MAISIEVGVFNWLVRLTGASLHLLSSWHPGTSAEEEGRKAGVKTSQDAGGGLRISARPEVRRLGVTKQLVQLQRRRSEEV